MKGKERKRKGKLAGSGKHADRSASGPTGIEIPGHLGFGIALRKRAHCNPHMLTTWAFQNFHSVVVMGCCLVLDLKALQYNLLNLYTVFPDPRCY
ncbi:hypothetical protein VNO80_22194 [Phaseolus coccineus]|uniref:Uncharacterized protein n=1 Tax=Phaseolus coccineus TaxID=3886 RepID=A0AAN9QTR9_PHACN